MGWDSSRPVPYRRLLKEWLIYAGIMVVLFLTLLRGSSTPLGMLLGLVVSLPLWLGLSYVLAKFGYQRKTLAQMRSARTATATPSGSSASSSSSNGAPHRPRPAPTRRTQTGHNRPQRKRR
jgi:hypothetical protein